MSGTIIIQPKKLSGSISAPPSKSCAHRAVIAAALARGRSVITNLELSQDIEATLGGVRALGARVELRAGSFGRQEAVVEGLLQSAAMPPLIDCRESGSTLRFLLPVALAVCGGAVFTGSGRLGQRPLGPYFDVFKEQGIEFEQSESGFPLTVQGKFEPSKFTVPGNVSSQFITGLLLACPLLGGPSEIAIEGELESLPYVDITVGVLRRFGVAVAEEPRGELYRIEPQQYCAAEYAVEGDWSQAAFPLLMGMLGGPVRLSGMDASSTQGDRVIQDIFARMGGKLHLSGSDLVSECSELHGTEADVSQCPDLAPAIAAAMAVAKGESRITGSKRLREKESDRLQSIATCLNSLGADVQETQDGLIIQGKAQLTGGSASSFNDHRIAMMAAAVTPACNRPIVLDGYGAVSKSWPGFWDAFQQLGGSLDGQPLGQ